MKTMTTRFAAAFSTVWTWAARTARLAVGVPDYEVYLAHVRKAHPDAVPMSHEAFFAERLHARYGKGRSRCC